LIHDSFIVDAKERSLLQETMDRVLETTKRKLQGKPHTLVGYSKNVPQYGDTMPAVAAHAPDTVAADTPQAEAAQAANDNTVSASLFAESA
jgi:hypothetical protein